MPSSRTLLFGLALLSTAPLIARAQDLGTYFSPCDPSTPDPQVQDGNYDGVGLGGQAYCSAPNSLMSGFSYCQDFAFDAFYTNTQSFFKCVQSLDSTCNGGCPTGTVCLGSRTSGPGSPYYYFCGVQCADGFFLCDNAGAQTLGANYVAYCNSATDECATCSSAADLSSDGTCSNPITAFGAYSSNSKKKRATSEPAWLREVEERCPYGSISCTSTDQFGVKVQECVEYLEDLYSCGGCIGSGGVDCTTLVEDDTSISCQQGQCVLHDIPSGGPASAQVALQKLADSPSKTTGGLTLARNLKRAADPVQITSKEQLKVKPWQEVIVIG